MAHGKIIAVVGATGAQGGSLARAILSDPDSDFTVRAITRDPSSAPAKALADAGAEVVEGDLTDPASIERAFTGAYGAYCVTPFWAHMSPERESADVRTMAEAARAAGLRHVVWSTLEDTRELLPVEDDRMPTLGGAYNVPHYDLKGESDHVWDELGVPTTYLLTSFYWDNLIHFGMQPQRGADGALTFNLPMGDRKLPGIASEDIGKCAYGIFKRGPEMVGRRVGIAGGHLTGTQMAEALTEALGEEVRYNAVPFDVYRSLGFPGADDLGNMFQFKHDFEAEYTGARPLDQAHALNPELQDFRSWATANKDRIPVDSAVS